MSILRFVQGDTILMKKKHPCGSDRFTVMRIGSDVRIICTRCSRDLTLPREALEKMIKKVLPKEDDIPKNK